MNGKRNKTRKKTKVRHESACIQKIFREKMFENFIFFLEFFERFHGSRRLAHFQHVEANSLGKGPAFAHCNNVVHSNVPKFTIQFIIKCLFKL